VEIATFSYLLLISHVVHVSYLKAQLALRAIVRIGFQLAINYTGSHYGDKYVRICLILISVKACELLSLIWPLPLQ
jgi:hypothetical protein